MRPALAALVDDDIAAAVFEASMASVVSLTAFRTEGREVVEEGVGSGVVWDRLGHIVSNYHCVARLAKDTTGQQATEVGITGAGGTMRYPARIVGLDPEKDLAVLRIDAPAADLLPVKVGTSGDLRVGQTVFAIGNPSGLSHTLTAGVVSGLNRAIPSPGGTLTGGAIQTDAAINSGSSGGALLDSSARLVGLSTATFTRRTQGARSSGVNFAIGVDVVRDRGVFLIGATGTVW
ncbi:hypothetical protein WJX81_000423 [Elliptochloris bilobata]|uniref:Trypsin-like serine protease n=1 Tax=Elliptochloris bilobata TaxID=381761 RepID=A0AAW1SFH8_9CHLO